MIFRLFRGSANRKLIGRLHGEVVAAARDPILFTDYGIEDSVDGRFESLVLHAAVVLSRLERLAPPGPQIAQDLVDTMFRHLDLALREIGVADTKVPKQMKAMAEAYGGRAQVYGGALARAAEDPRVLSDALSRNVYGGQQDGERLARYVRKLDAALAQTSVAEFLKGPIPFPSPALSRDGAAEHE